MYNTSDVININSICQPTPPPANICDHKVNMNRLLPLIRSKLGKHPTLTNCVYYGSLFCAAEVSQQVYIRKYLPKKQVSRCSLLKR